jgi:hypothetical protein
MGVMNNQIDRTNEYLSAVQVNNENLEKVNALLLEINTIQQKIT